MPTERACTGSSSDSPPQSAPNRESKESNFSRGIRRALRVPAELLTASAASTLQSTLMATVVMPLSRWVGFSIIAAATHRTQPNRARGALVPPADASAMPIFLHGRLALETSVL